MAVDFYLSEMSVSDLHGGGLTLQRVLGEDLDRIRVFVHVNRFASDFPPCERTKPRSLDLFTPLESDQARGAIGCRPAAWLARRPLFRAWHGRRAARAVSARFAGQKAPLRAVVCPQGADSLYTIEALSRLRHVEYISWVMDDHLVRWSGNEWHYPPGIERLLARHLQRAKRIFVISPAMGEFYRSRFGIESEVLFGPADVLRVPAATASPVRGLRLGYFGAVDQWQLDALCVVADALPIAEASLDVYSGGGALPMELQRPQVSFKGRLAPAQVVRAMGTYHAVVLPVSFRSDLRHMSQFNIATKMGECLASGAVTLLVGPNYAAMVRFLAGSGAACIASSPLAEAVVEALRHLRNPEWRQRTLTAARDFLVANASVEVMRQRWSSAAVLLDDCKN